MITTDIVVIGGGPAGMNAAVAAASQGARVYLLERDGFLGGQLNKQTHKFFGSEKQHAAKRGMDIAGLLKNELGKQASPVTVLTNATAIGLYEDGMLTVEHDGKYLKILAKAIVICTGASEKFLAFPNNDLPGIYGAGAVQTLMNLYGVVPAKSVVMVGAGNIGLIVSYQLIQAGVEVQAVIDAAPNIGGYLVHAAKLRRMGVPIYTSTTVKAAHGTNALTGVTLAKLDDRWQIIEGSEQEYACDCLCIAVGLSPLTELLWQAGCEMRYIPQLGGHVAVRNERMRTSIENIYIAGDVAGVEEASAAMVEGRLAGLNAAGDLGFRTADSSSQITDCQAQLHDLRSGPTGEKIKSGLLQCTKEVI